MARPKAHVISTVLAIVPSWAVVYFPFILAERSLIDLALIFVFGILIDADHINWTKALMVGFREAVRTWLDADHENFFHSWKGFLVVLTVSVLLWIFFGIWLPFLAYMVHMVIDAGARNQKDYPKCSTFPGFLGRFLPQWYSTVVK